MSVKILWWTKDLLNDNLMREQETTTRLNCRKHYKLSELESYKVSTID